MSSEMVVQARDLGKKFKIYKKPWDRAREWLAFGTRSYHTDFWALKEIAFELRRGEALGNGDGNRHGAAPVERVERADRRVVSPGAVPARPQRGGGEAFGEVRQGSDRHASPGCAP